MSNQVVAIVCRISKANGREDGVEAQERQGRAYAAAHWPGVPVEPFIDNDITAADDTLRPDFERFREWVAAGRVAHVWAAAQSRLERREVEWFRMRAELYAAGISELHTRDEGTVEVQGVVSGIKAVLNAEEVRTIRKRVTAKLADNASQGIPSGGTVFGYRHAVSETGTKTLVVVDAQAEAIRWAAEKVLAGWALSRIAARLREQGLTGSHGGTIGVSAVKSMLTNPAISNKRRHQGRIVGDGNWEAILDDDTRLAVTRKLDGDRLVRRTDGGTYPVAGSAQRGQAKGRRYALTGLARCGVSGEALTGAAKWRNKDEAAADRTPYLTCPKGCVGIKYDEAERFVVDALWAELDKPEFLEMVAADEGATERDRITKALAALDAQRNELADMWAEGELDRSGHQVAKAKLDARENVLRDELAEVPPPLVNVDIAAARESWPSMTLDEQREFLRLFVDKVIVNKATAAERVEVVWITR